MHPHSEVLSAFGGPRPLARAIGIDPNIASHWWQRGIPQKYWFDVEDAAAKLELPVTARQLRSKNGSSCP